MRYGNLANQQYSICVGGYNVVDVWQSDYLVSLMKGKADFILSIVQFLLKRYNRDVFCRVR